MEGFLKIKREIFWEKNYFILTNDSLVFCRRKGEAIKGQFHLKISTVSNIENKPSLILLFNGFSQVYLEAENVGEKIKWINAFLYKQEELRKFDNQEIYNLQNLDILLERDHQTSEEVKEILENKFQNSVAELWNLQTIVDENLDSLSSKIKDTFTINILKKIENAVSLIKVFKIFFLITIL